MARAAARATRLHYACCLPHRLNGRRSQNVTASTRPCPNWHTDQTAPTGTVHSTNAGTYQTAPTGTATSASPAAATSTAIATATATQPCLSRVY